MATLLIIVATVGYLAAVICLWALCRAAKRRDEWRERDE